MKISSMKSGVKSARNFLTAPPVWSSCLAVGASRMVCPEINLRDALLCGAAVGFIFLAIRSLIKTKPGIENVIAGAGALFALTFSVKICGVMPDPKSWVVIFNQISGVIIALAFAKLLYSADDGENRLKLGVAMVTFVGGMIEGIAAPGGFSFISAGRFITIFGYGSLAVSLLVFYIWIWRVPIKMTLIMRDGDEPAADGDDKITSEA